jgi:hypothetical protein
MTADFLLCRHCGVYVGAMMQSESKRFGIVNVRVLLSLTHVLPVAKAMDYEGEGTPERTTRRESRWTPMEVG